MAEAVDRPESTPPGWYPDPKFTERERFFDGQDWTADVRDAGGLASDPLGPLPAGRDAWTSPMVMKLLHRPATETWWTRHRWKVAVGAAAVLVTATVATAFAAPRARSAIAFVSMAAVGVGALLWKLDQSD
jgi:hypothetical protein